MTPEIVKRMRASITNEEYERLIAHSGIQIIRLQSYIKELEGKQDLPDHYEENLRLKAHVIRLVEAFEQYSGHGTTCDLMSGAGKDCTCGYLITCGELLENRDE